MRRVAPLNALASVAVAACAGQVVAQDVTIRLLASEPTITLGEEVTLLAVYESVGVETTGLAEIDLTITNSLLGGTEIVAWRFPGGWANGREFVRLDDTGGLDRVWGLRLPPLFGSDPVAPPLTAFEFDARVIAPGPHAFAAMASEDHDYGGVQVYNGDTPDTIAEPPDTLAFVDASVTVVSPCGTGTIYDLAFAPCLAVRTDGASASAFEFAWGLAVFDPFLRTERAASVVDPGGADGAFAFSTAADLGGFVRDALAAPGWAVSVDDPALDDAQRFDAAFTPETGLADGVEALMRPFFLSEPSSGATTSEIPLIGWAAVPPPAGSAAWETGRIRIVDAAGGVVEAALDPAADSYQVQTPLAPGGATATVTFGVTDADGLGVAVVGPCSSTGETVLGRSPVVAPVEILTEASVSFTVELGSPCNAADIAPPFGVLDLADLSVFIGGFLAQDPIADLNQDGILDLSDLAITAEGFLAGCP